MKSYYFFVSYQIFSKGGALIGTGHSLESISTGVEGGEFEHFGLKELRKSLLKQAMKENGLVDETCKLIFTSINELSKGLWNQLADNDVTARENEDKVRDSKLKREAKNDEKG